MPVLVVVNDLNILRSCSGPAEADAPLVVDADAVLTVAVALKRLKSIAGRGAQELECRRCLELRELPGSHLNDRPEACRFAGFKELASVAALEALNHRAII